VYSHRIIVEKIQKILKYEIIKKEVYALKIASLNNILVN
jgi:hypothetical protein